MGKEESILIEEFIRLYPEDNQVILEMSLYGAVQSSNSDLVSRLIDKGAPISSDVLVQAVINGNLTVLPLLITVPELDLNTSATIAAETGYREIVLYLVAWGADNYSDIVSSASGFGDSILIDLILPFGDIDFDSALGESALHGHIVKKNDSPRSY